MSTEADPKTKRTLHRSPRYPGLTFRDAFERIGTVYKEDRRSPATPKVVLGHLGLAVGSGPANRILSALKQYGLLDENAGQLRVSDAAFKMITLSEGSSERTKLIREAALKPPIIQEILAEYPEGLPSDANLGDFLIGEKGFNPDAVSFFIKVIRDNLSVVETLGAEYGTPTEADEGVALDQHALETTSPAQSEGPQEVSAPFTYPLSRDCMGYVRFRGRPTRGDVDRLIEFLKLSRLAFPAHDVSGEE